MMLGFVLTVVGAMLKSSKANKNYLRKKNKGGNKMELSLIILIIYLVGFVCSLFYIFRSVGCIRIGFLQGLFCGIFWFIVMPIGFILAYFYDKKQNRSKKLK